MPTLDADARRKIGTTVTVAGALDLSLATVEIEVENVRYPMAWTSTGDLPATTRTAETDGCLTGPDATSQVGDIVLAAGRRRAQVIVTFPDAQVIPGADHVIDVRST